MDGRNIRRTDVIHRIYHEYPSRNRETGEEIGKIARLTTLKQVRQPTKIVRLVCKLFAGVGWAGQSNIFLTAKTCLSTINCNSKNFTKSNILSNIPIYSDKIEVVNIYIISGTTIIPHPHLPRQHQHLFASKPSFTDMSGKRADLAANLETDKNRH